VNVAPLLLATARLALQKQSRTAATAQSSSEQSGQSAWQPAIACQNGTRDICAQQEIQYEPMIQLQPLLWR
jgi:nitrate/nitrite-specific signal transduction histidine kinase